MGWVLYAFLHDDREKREKKTKEKEEREFRMKCDWLGEYLGEERTC